MIQNKRSLNLVAKLSGALLILSVFAYNVGVRVDSRNGSLSLSTLKAYADEGDENEEEEVDGDLGCPQCTFVKDIQVSQEMYVKSITGTAAGQAGISIGTKFNSGWSAAIKASLTAELTGVYKITCLSGGNVACVPSNGLPGYVLCPPAGCPTMATTGQ